MDPENKNAAFPEASNKYFHRKLQTYMQIGVKYMRIHTMAKNIIILTKGVVSTILVVKSVKIMFWKDIIYMTNNGQRDMEIGIILLIILSFGNDLSHL